MSTPVAPIVVGSIWYRCADRRGYRVTAIDGAKITITPTASREGANRGGVARVTERWLRAHYRTQA